MMNKDIVSGIFIGLCFIVGVYAYSNTTVTREQYNITCYNPQFEITYMSITPVLLANDYGLWASADGSGAYIQQSGDTCIAEVASAAVQDKIE